MFRKPLPSELQAEALKLNRYAIEVDPSVVLDDLASQSFWQNVAPKLRPGDIVGVYSIDNTLDVEVRILSNKSGLVKYRVLRAYEDEKAKAAKLVRRDGEGEEELTGALFYAKWLGPNARFAVVNRITKEAVERNITDKADAEKRAAELNAEAQTAKAA